MKIQINFKDKDITLMDEVKTINIVTTCEKPYINIETETISTYPFCTLDLVDLIEVDGEIVYQSDEYLFSKMDAIKSLPKIYEEICKIIQK